MRHGTPTAVLFERGMLEQMEVWAAAAWKDKKANWWVALMPQGSVGVAGSVLTLDPMARMTINAGLIYIGGEWTVSSAASEIWTIR